MKALLLATALLATPLVAQMTPAPADPAPPPTTTSTTTTTATDPMATTSTTTGTDGANSMNSTMAPPASTTPVFQQPQTVDQAYPAPPPKANYPWCSKTVTDGCKQRYDPK